MTRDEEIFANRAGKYFISTKSSSKYKTDENACIRKSVMMKIDWETSSRYCPPHLGLCHFLGGMKNLAHSFNK